MVMNSPTTLPLTQKKISILAPDFHEFEDLTGTPEIAESNALVSPLKVLTFAIIFTICRMLSLLQSKTEKLIPLPWTLCHLLQKKPLLCTERI
jgi:hypothetical protein